MYLETIFIGILVLTASNVLEGVVKRFWFTEIFGTSLKENEVKYCLQLISYEYSVTQQVRLFCLCCHRSIVLFFI